MVSARSARVKVPTERIMRILLAGATRKKICNLPIFYAFAT